MDWAPAAAYFPSNLPKLKYGAKDWNRWKTHVSILLHQSNLRSYMSTTKPDNWSEEDDFTAYGIMYKGLGSDLANQCCVFTSCSDLWTHLTDTFEFESPGVPNALNAYETFMDLNRSSFNNLGEGLTALECSIAECRAQHWEIKDKIKTIQLFRLAKDDFPEWVSRKRGCLQHAKKDDDHLDFKFLIAEARDYLRAFTPSPAGNKPKCSWCGNAHEVSDCFHINPQKAPAGFKANEKLIHAYMNMNKAANKGAGTLETPRPPKSNEILPEFREEFRDILLHACLCNLEGHDCSLPGCHAKHYCMAAKHQPDSPCTMCNNRLETAPQGLKNCPVYMSRDGRVGKVHNKYFASLTEPCSGHSFCPLRSKLRCEHQDKLCLHNK